MNWRDKLLAWTDARRALGHDVFLGYNFADDRTSGEHVVAHMRTGDLR